MTVSTSGGNIRVGSSKGPVVARTGGGNIELSNLARGADARSGMGRIQAEFLGSSGAIQSALQTGDGDIVVYVKSGVPLTVRATTEIAAGQGIRSDYPGDESHRRKRRLGAQDDVRRRSAERRWSAAESPHFDRANRYPARADEEL